MILHIEDKEEARLYMGRLVLDSVTFVLYLGNGNLLHIRDILGCNSTVP